MIRKYKKRKNNISFIYIAVVFLFILFVIKHKNVSDGILCLIVFLALAFASATAAKIYFSHRRKKQVKETLLAAGTTNPMQLNPEQYEHFCAVLIENHGWRVSMTKKSGDYGADIIAINGNQRMVVQCKQWSKSVGIKAVQEAHSAGTYYHATIAAVVTTTGYTPAARNLAESTGVRLLSHDDLARGIFNG
ncbi:MAG: restriction endonuclease [Acidithiobacillus sp.]